MTETTYQRYERRSAEIQRQGRENSLRQALEGAKVRLQQAEQMAAVARQARR